MLTEILKAYEIDGMFLGSIKWREHYGSEEEYNHPRGERTHTNRYRDLYSRSNQLVGYIEVFPPQRLERDLVYSFEGWYTDSYTGQKKRRLDSYVGQVQHEIGRLKNGKQSASISSRSYGYIVLDTGGDFWRLVGHRFEHKAFRKIGYLCHLSDNPALL